MCQDKSLETWKLWTPISFWSTALPVDPLCSASWDKPSVWGLKTEEESVDCTNAGCLLWRSELEDDSESDGTNWSSCWWLVSLTDAAQLHVPAFSGALDFHQNQLMRLVLFFADCRGSRSAEEKAVCAVVIKEFKVGTSDVWFIRTNSLLSNVVRKVHTRTTRTSHGLSRRHRSRRGWTDLRCDRLLLPELSSSDSSSSLNVAAFNLSWKLRCKSSSGTGPTVQSELLRSALWSRFNTPGYL